MEVQKEVRSAPKRSGYVDVLLLQLVSFPNALKCPRCSPLRLPLPFGCGDGTHSPAVFRYSFGKTQGIPRRLLASQPSSYAQADDGAP